MVGCSWTIFVPTWPSLHWSLVSVSVSTDLLLPSFRMQIEQRKGRNSLFWRKRGGRVERGRGELELELELAKLIENISQCTPNIISNEIWNSLTLLILTKIEPSRPLTITFSHQPNKKIILSERENVSVFPFSRCSPALSFSLSNNANFNFTEDDETTWINKCFKNNLLGERQIFRTFFSTNIFLSNSLCLLQPCYYAWFLVLYWQWNCSGLRRRKITWDDKKVTVMSP